MKIQTLKSKVSKLIENRLFNILIIILIIFSVLTIIINSIPEIQGLEIQKYLRAFELFVVIIFTFEYIFRVWSSSNRLKTIFSFLIIIDFLAIFPFYFKLLFPTLLLDLRILRMLRVFRILRIFKLARYSKALKILGYILKQRLPQLTVFLFIVVIVLFFVSSFIYYIEPNNFKSIPAAFWWSIVTLTTVGYGDVYPTTILGKLFAGIVMIVGIGIIAIPTGIISSGLTEYFITHDNTKKCKKCSCMNDLDAEYCKMCGKKLS